MAFSFQIGVFCNLPLIPHKCKQITIYQFSTFHILPSPLVSNSKIKSCQSFVYLLRLLNFSCPNCANCVHFCQTLLASECLLNMRLTCVVHFRRFVFDRLIELLSIRTGTDCDSITYIISWDRFITCGRDSPAETRLTSWVFRQSKSRPISPDRLKNEEITVSVHTAGHVHNVAIY